jgi:hypothetical protein
MVPPEPKIRRHKKHNCPFDVFASFNPRKLMVKAEMDPGAEGNVSVRLAL